MVFLNRTAGMSVFRQAVQLQSNYAKGMMTLLSRALGAVNETTIISLLALCFDQTSASTSDKFDRRYMHRSPGLTNT